MHPLTRQPTLDSVFSWWSDRNPVGPNINLHAAAKPLMRLLYHRDALAFIRAQLGTPLSKETMEIYSSYLAYNYVSSSTKSAILVQLRTRVESEDEARAVTDSLGLHLIGDLLGSPDAEVRRAMCWILEGLAHHQTTTRAAMEYLVSLLSENLKTIESAAETLYRICGSFQGAQAAVDANVLEYVAKLLESLNEEVRKWTCNMLEELARHEITTRATVGYLVSLLRDGNLEVIESAAETLYRIATSPQGAQAAVDADVLECVAKLAEPANEKVRKWTYYMLGELVRHETTTGGNLKVIEIAVQTLYRISGSFEGAQAAVNANVLECVAKLLESPNEEVHKRTRHMLEELVRPETTAREAVEYLVSLLNSGNLKTIESAAETLYRICGSFQGAQAAVDANVLEYVAKLLGSPNEEVRKWTCDMLETLARHEITTRVTVGYLVPLLHGGNLKVIEIAAATLYRISGSSRYAQEAVDANVSESAAKLLESPNEEVRKWTKSQLSVLEPGVDLYSGGKFRVIESTAETLYRIATSPQGAQAAVEANVLECVAKLLESPNEIQKWTWYMLEELARHETTTRPATGYLVSLLRDGNVRVIESAAQTLYRISRSFRGAQVAVDANVLECVAKLLESPNEEVRKWTCGGNIKVIETTAKTLYRMSGSFRGAQAAVDANVLECVANLLESLNDEVRKHTWYMLGELARHETTTKGAMGYLVSLLSSGNLKNIESAAQTLYRVTTSPEGAKAALDAKVLECVAKLLESPNDEVRKWTWYMLGELARHETTTKATIGYLVSLLSGNLKNIESAAQTLYRISRLFRGTQAAVDANVLECVAKLLESPNERVQKGTCDMLGELARHEVTAPAVLGVNSCPPLVSLLRGGNIGIVWRVAHTLYRIATSSSPTYGEGSRTTSFNFKKGKMLNDQSSKITTSWHRDSSDATDTTHGESSAQRNERPQDYLQLLKINRMYSSLFEGFSLLHFTNAVISCSKLFALDWTVRFKKNNLTVEWRFGHLDGFSGALEQVTSFASSRSSG
ncbi:armadillo-type protein [Mycena leptocephala]|nr:armadillo-type protein [Mycena leptocephala]